MARHRRPDPAPHNARDTSLRGPLGTAPPLPHLAGGQSLPARPRPGRHRPAVLEPRPLVSAPPQSSRRPSEPHPAQARRPHTRTPAPGTGATPVRHRPQPPAPSRGGCSVQSVATAPWERAVCAQTDRSPDGVSSYCEQLDQRHERGSSAVTRSAGISGSLVAAVVLLAAGGTAATALTHEPEPVAEPVARTVTAAGPTASSQPGAVRPVSTQQSSAVEVAPAAPPAPLDALTTAIEDLVAQRGRPAPPEPTPPPRLASAAPTYGTVTSSYGSRWGTTHYGLDIANVIGTPVVSTSDGEIIESGPADGFGLWIRVLQDDGTIGVYGHINETLVSAGQRVQAGEQIATVGNRGYSTGPHLHYEVWQGDGVKLDPAQWLRNRGVDLG